MRDDATATPGATGTRTFAGMPPGGAVDLGAAAFSAGDSTAVVAAMGRLVAGALRRRHERRWLERLYAAPAFVGLREQQPYRAGGCQG